MFKCSFVFAVLAIAGMSADNAQASTPWSTYRDHRGFVVSRPSGWTVQALPSKQIVVKSPDGSMFAFVQPFKTEGGSSADWIDAHLGSTLQGMQVAQSRQIDGQPDTTIAGLTFHERGGDAQASVMCAIDGHDGIVYGIAALRSQFSSRRDTLIRIVESLCFVGPSSHPHEAAGAQHLRYTGFVDPREHAFHLQVPAGWKSTGGLYRSGALDIRPVVECDSPDGQMRCVFGTKGIDLFAEPTAMMEQLGFHEGSYYTPGHGQQEIVMHYMEGEDFAHFYIQQTLGGDVPDLKFIKSDHLDKLSSILTQAVSLGSVPGMNIAGSAGYTVFEGTYKGKRYLGMCEALVSKTEYESVPGGLWAVRALMTAIAPAPKMPTAMAAIQHMANSFAYYPEFNRREGQYAGELAHILMRQTQENDRAFQDMDNVINGTVDLVNPNTGEQTQGQLGANYYWSNGSTVVGINTYEPPSVNFTPLKQVW